MHTGYCRWNVEHNLLQAAPAKSLVTVARAELELQNMTIFILRKGLLYALALSISLTGMVVREKSSANKSDRPQSAIDRDDALPADGGSVQSTSRRDLSRQMAGQEKVELLALVYLPTHQPNSFRSAIACAWSMPPSHSLLALSIKIQV
jgi:hypothetical protein